MGTRSENLIYLWVKNYSAYYFFALVVPSVSLPYKLLRNSLVLMSALAFILLSQSYQKHYVNNKFVWDLPASCLILKYFLNPEDLVAAHWQKIEILRS